MAKTSKKKVSKKTASRKVTKKKAAKKKAAPRKTAPRKPAARKAPETTVEKLSGNVKKLMLANLGLYGKVLDELQSQASRAAKVIKDARSNPSKVNKQLVKRGEALADQITDIVKQSGAPISKELDKQLKDLRKAIDKLKHTIKR
ncbi:MAG: hypothetical protein QNJ07_01325 [Woeseiaceae bacterium]|nr:hypothetical protein [Woeseiaceae bacterium]